MNKRDRSCDEWIAKMRVLLEDNAQDVIGQMESAVTEMLEPEEHECRLGVYYAFRGPKNLTSIYFKCECGEGYEATAEEIEDWANTMRHLDAGTLDEVADYLSGALLWGRWAAIVPKLRAAADAMRKGKGD